MNRISSFSLAIGMAFCAVAAAQSQAPQEQPRSDNPPAASSQNTVPPLIDAPAPQPPARSYEPSPNDSYVYHVGAFCGAGASTSVKKTTPAVGCGAGFTLLPLPLFVEVGLLAPQAGRSRLSGYVSLDASFALARSSSKYLPFAMVGYSRLFETGHAIDYGLALALPRPGKPRDQTSSLRIELRDYCIFANPTQHNVMLRIGCMAVETD